MNQIVHSDRGSQYASQDYRNLLSQQGLQGSMSRKGDCWDNAVMGRFFLKLKMERVWRRDYANHQEAVWITSLAFITVSVCIPHWAICRPMAMNGKWQMNNLFCCPKKLDHYR